MKVVTKNKAVMEIEKAFPTVEKRVTVNGDLYRLVLKAENIQDATGIGYKVKQNCPAIFNVDGMALIGNVASGKVAELLDKAAATGTLDLSGLTYQPQERQVFDARKTKLDDGVSGAFEDKDIIVLSSIDGCQAAYSGFMPQSVFDEDACLSGAD